VSYNERRECSIPARGDGVPMPPQWVPWLAEYVERNYKPEPKKRSRRLRSRGQSAMTRDDKEDFCPRCRGARSKRARPRRSRPRRSPGGAGAWGSGGCEHRRSRGADGTRPRRASCRPLESLKGLASEIQRILKPG